MSTVEGNWKDFNLPVRSAPGDDLPSVNRGNFRIASVLHSLPPPPSPRPSRRPGRASEGASERAKRRERSELWRRHILSGRIEPTFADFGAGILRQTAPNFKVGLQTEVGPRPHPEDSGPQGRPEAGFEEDWAPEGAEVHSSSERGAGRPAAPGLPGIAGGRWQPRSLRLAIRSASERRGERRWPPTEPRRRPRL